MARNDLIILVDDDRIEETKSADAVSDLPDLVLGVCTGVLRISFKVPDRNIDDQEVSYFGGCHISSSPWLGLELTI
jgi:hypothetical protein